MRGKWWHAAGVCVLGVVGLASVPVFADVTPAQRAASRALFDQARKLAGAGNYAEACPKFEESNRLDPGIGTMFNLADCYEHVGRTAAAWSMFLEVASQARNSGQPDREKAARKRADVLETKLSRINIVVPANVEVPGIEVRLDNAVINKPMWGTPVPVDPGAHVIEVTAPGRKKWSFTAQIAATAGNETINVPTLDTDAGGAVVPPPPPTASATAKPPATVVPPPTVAPTAAPTPAPTPSTPPPSDGAPGSTQRTLGLVSGGVGLVGVGVSLFIGSGAKKKVDDSKSHCTGNVCDQSGVDLRSDAVKQANLATIVGGIGGVLLVGGAVLYFTAPSGSSTAAARTKPTTSVAVGPGSLWLTGAW